MTIARSLKIDLSKTPYYHCMSRCVRRAFLCGIDEVSGKDYSHRKKWVLNRLKHLASIFAIKIVAYSIMDNHYHLVLYVNESQAKSWDQREIITRWSLLYPLKAAELKKLLINPIEKEEIIKRWRSRLMSISEFMACINQYIARLCNIEDNCLGRFWEGRFKSQALLDEGALITAMAYVDLNPIRSKKAISPEESEFTSVKDRIDTIKSKSSETQPEHLVTLSASKNSLEAIHIEVSDYLQLVDETGRIIREDKSGFIRESLQPILTRLNLSPDKWIQMVKNIETEFNYLVGSTVVLADFSIKSRKRRPKGIKAANLFYIRHLKLQPRI